MRATDVLADTTIAGDGWDLLGTGTIANVNIDRGWGKRIGTKRRINLRSFQRLRREQPEHSTVWLSPGSKHRPMAQTASTLARENTSSSRHL